MLVRKLGDITSNLVKARFLSFSSLLSPTMQSVPFSTIQSHLPNNLPPSPSPYLNPLPSYWTKNYISPHQNSNQFNSFPNAQDEEKGVEIVVIGSGITGVCTAYRIVQGLLARGKDEVGGKKEKVKIIILEAREFCSGATGRFYFLPISLFA